MAVKNTLKQLNLKRFPLDEMVPTHRGMFSAPRLLRRAGRHETGGPSLTARPSRSCYYCTKEQSFEGGENASSAAMVLTCSIKSHLPLDSAGVLARYRCIS